MKNIVILGSTGSIGSKSIDVILRNSNNFKLYAISSYNKINLLAKQAYCLNVRIIILPNYESYKYFLSIWKGSYFLPEIRIGSNSLSETVSDIECDIVISAITGISSLPSILSAISSGKKVLIANKEVLVTAGSLIMNLAKKNNSDLIPIDSEHNAILQCLNYANNSEIKKITLTASGGPFLNCGKDFLQKVKPKDAFLHPNWEMGKKISVDSATLFNKGIEVIEAFWLFSIPVEKIEVTIHPQSILHSMVSYKDGSIIAQLGHPDIRMSISYGLNCPGRMNSGVNILKISEIECISFKYPNFKLFPCLKLSFEALYLGQGACIVINAVNEIAVNAFLEGKLNFNSIHKKIDDSLNWYTKQSNSEVNSISDIFYLDLYARNWAKDMIY